MQVAVQLLIQMVIQVAVLVQKAKAMQVAVRMQMAIQVLEQAWETVSAPRMDWLYSAAAVAAAQKDLLVLEVVVGCQKDWFELVRKAVQTLAADLEHSVARMTIRLLVTTAYQSR